MLKRIINSPHCFLVALVILLCLAFTGCGSKDEQTTAAPVAGQPGAPGMPPGSAGMAGAPGMMPPGSAGMGGVPGMGAGMPGAMGAGAALTTSTGTAQPMAEQIAFSKVSLQSPVKAITNSLGQVFLSFKYADVDGKVYQALLPKEMSEGSYSRNEWILTFNAYKKSAPIKKINMASAKSWQSVEDYPFISPRPVKAASVTTLNSRGIGGGGVPGAPGMMPQLPGLPGMGGASGGPGRPGMPPMPPMQR